MSTHSTPDIFERLRRKKSIIKKTEAVSAVFFQLNHDEKGAYVTVVNGKGKDILASYEHYNGHVRELLKAIENIRDKNSFRIDWENPENRVYLAEHEYLIWQLQHCPNIVLAGHKSVRFASCSTPSGEITLAKMVVCLDEKDGMINSRIISSIHGDTFEGFSFLTEAFVLVKDTIYQIQPLGENFNNLSAFNTTFLPINLERYLSLVYSYFDNVSITYEDYKPIIGEPKQTRPTIIFEKVDGDNSLYLRISTSLPGFDAEFFDSYDVSKIVLLNELEKKIVVSDLIGEEIYDCFAEIDKLLKKYKKLLKDKNDFFFEDNLFIIEESLAREFVYKELPNLIANFAILGAERLKSYRIKAVTPTLSLSMSHGIDFLEGDVNLEIEGENFSLFDALNQYKKSSYIELSDGSHAIINAGYLNKLQRIFKKHKKNVKISFFDLPIIEELIDERIAQESFKRSREIFMGFNTLKEAQLDFPQMNGDLREYQKHGYKWIKYLQQHSLGGCLADDMGLGKTIQAIALLASIYPDEKKPSLILMPKTLLFNWANELERFSPQLSYSIHHGTNRSLSEAKASQIILTTYATMRNDIEEFKEEEFHYIILDESQNIKNLNSQVSKAVMILKSNHRLALSGTPIENNLSELYALFRFLNPSMFGSIDDFNQFYTSPIQRDGDKDAMHELKKKIYPFILRRVKKDVLQDLPDKVEQTLFVEMSPEQKTFYEQRRRFYHHAVKSQIAQNGITKSQFFILQALSELRQIASIPESKTDDRIISPKREVIMENIMDVIANGHKVLVFANFMHVLDCLAQDMEREGIDYLLMTGATRDRKALVERFQNDETYKVFLMTLKTGGIGLNLTAADYIFIFDPWWNKSAENQAIDRAHRIGQDKTVFSYKLITKDTIEEKMLQLQGLKSELFENLISTDGASIKSLDESDVEFVLGG
ncbi:MAG: SNF2-related protein [bacterium]|nr:SNF2-related protein [bacterium]